MAHSSSSAVYVPLTLQQFLSQVNSPPDGVLRIAYDDQAGLQLLELLCTDVRTRKATQRGQVTGGCAVR